MDNIRSLGQTHLASDSLFDYRKSPDLYQAVLENISVNIPLIQPSSTMSDWEPAQRNHFEMFLLK